MNFKKVFGNIKKGVRKTGKRVSKYQSEAPMRRASEVKRLQSEIKIAKLKSQLKKYKPKQKEQYF